MCVELLRESSTGKVRCVAIGMCVSVPFLIVVLVFMLDDVAQELPARLTPKQAAPQSSTSCSRRCMFGC